MKCCYFSPNKKKRSQCRAVLFVQIRYFKEILSIHFKQLIFFFVKGNRPPGEAENSRDQRMAKSKRKVYYFYYLFLKLAFEEEKKLQ